MALIDEIAKEIGVSPATVRNVLSGRNKEVWPSAKIRADQIREAAARRRYRVNTAARAIATGRFNNIALVLSHDYWRVHLFPETLLAIRESAREAKQNIVISDLPGDDSISQNLPNYMRELSVDGMLVSCVDDAVESVHKWAEHYRVPAVWMNVKLDSDCVYPDDLEGGRLATEHLLKLGHQSILYIDHSRNRHYSRFDRLNGYESAMHTAGLHPRVFDMEHLTPHEDITAIFQSEDRPSAIVAYEWEFAIKVYCTALKAGLKIPEDLSMITFHSWPVFVTDLLIDTMVIPANLMGQTAFAELVKKIDDPDYKVKPMTLGYEYFEGQTCARIGTRS